jgi:glycosyltransferase involved in cell wall biosynthesis
MASDKKPKVLVFVDWYHPGYRAGGPIRSMWNMINALCNRIDFFVITRNTDYLQTEPYAGISADSWQTLNDGHHVWYCSEGKTSQFDFIKAVEQIGQPDVIYINGIFSPVFSIQPARMIKKGTLKAEKCIISPRGMFAPDALKIKSLKKKLFLNFARITGLYKPFIWHATNATEANQVKKVVGSAAKCISIPNLIDRSNLVADRQIEKQPGKLRLASVARIAPEKNLLYALERLSEMPSGEIHLDVYGSVYSEQYMQQCQAVCNRLPANITVAFHGETPNNALSKTLQPYHALILPTLGENFGHIIAESLMANVPVMISNRTPWNDIQQAGAGWVIPLEEPQQWIISLQALCNMDQSTYIQYCQQAFAYISAKTNQEQAITEYLELFG